MADVWVPPLMRDLTDGREQVSVPGRTVGEVIAALDEAYPGIRDRLCEGGRLKPRITAWVDGRAAGLGLLAPAGKESEIHFLPLIAGG